jgi:DNA adenine methylase
MLPQHSVRSCVSAVPFLRWAGSKRRLLPILRTYWRPQYSRYLEPFAGSACFFFSLNAPRAILGDLNGELISTYLQVKYRLDALLDHLSTLRRSRQEYRKLRSLNPNDLDLCARAARFIYLNRYCFNGLYRTNLKGEFNVPYGGEKSGNLPSADLLRECSKRLMKTRLVAGDFEQVLRQAKKGDFVYMDPPFAVGARRVFNEYHPDTFGGEDINRLRLWMEKLDKRGISFLVSYAESAEADLLAKGFTRRHVSVRRNIAGFAADRSDSHEILISNT